jgi:hypothetical protein
MPAKPKVEQGNYGPSGAPSSRTLGSGVASADIAWHPDGMPEALTWRDIDVATKIADTCS